MFGAMCNHPHIVNELLACGASLTNTNINGHSALALAVKQVRFTFINAKVDIKLFKSPCELFNILTPAPSITLLKNCYYW